MRKQFVAVVLLGGIAGLVIGFMAGQWAQGDDGADGEDAGISPEAGAGPAAPVRLGWVERARILPIRLPVHAKLDSGAKRTSLNAINPRIFRRDGKRWVRFEITNREGTTAMLEKEVVGEVKVKRFLGRQLVRPVILLHLCVGGVQKEVAVSLQDRTGFDYQLLIGRTFMAGDIMVDPASKYLGDGTCAGSTEG